MQSIKFKFLYLVIKIYFYFFSTIRRKTLNPLPETLSCESLSFTIERLWIWVKHLHQNMKIGQQGQDGQSGEVHDGVNLATHETHEALALVVAASLCLGVEDLHHAGVERRHHQHLLPPGQEGGVRA